MSNWEIPFSEIKDKGRRNRVWEKCRVLLDRSVLSCLLATNWRCQLHVRENLDFGTKVFAT